MKKICIIIPTHWSARMGGSQYQAKCLVEALIATNRYEIFYLANRIKNSFKTNGYELIQISKRKKIGRIGFILDAPKLLKILKEIKPDIIYQRVGCGYTGIAAYFAKKNDCNMVWHIAHDLDVSPFQWKLRSNLLQKYLERKLLNYGITHAKHIIAQTEQQKKLLKINYGRDAIVIANFHPIPREEICKKEPIKIVWIANLKSWKQPELFVRVAMDLQNLKNVEFIMIGEDQGAYSNIQSQIEKLDNLKYLGVCSQEDVNFILAKAHIFVNTSIHEGFANTFIQAWMRKIPVISLNVNPNGLLSKGDIGFFSKGNYRDMLKQLELLINNKQLREKMGKAAQEYALNYHSEANIEKLIEIIDG